MFVEFELIIEINKELVESNRPFQIVNLAGGYVYSTRPEYGMLLQQVIKSKIKKSFFLTVNLLAR